MITAYTDGAARGNPGKASCAFVVYDGDREVAHEGMYLSEKEPHTNNYAEYMALINLLLWAATNKVKGMRIYSDSILVVNQVNCKWKRNPPLNRLSDHAYSMMICGDHKLFHIRGHVGILGNEMADAICNEVLDAQEGKQ